MTDTRMAYEGSHHTGAESGGSILGHIWASIGATIVLGVICCGVYPLVVYGVAQVCFPNQANGSLVKRDGTPTTDDTQAVGSSLIGQNFGAAYYFHPRPSAAGSGYDATSSGGSNLGPLSDKLINGQTQAATPPATAPATQPDTQAATASAPATAAATTAPAATTSAPATAPATQPAETLAFDGIRLRVLHYAVDNSIRFSFYYSIRDKDGNVLSKTPVPAADLLKFQDKDGNLNDVALVDAFPHPAPATDPADKKYQYVIGDDFATLIPADAVTASGSGLDPHISPRNAELQAQRVADARKLSKEKVLELVRQNTDQPGLGVLGDPGVNVLMLNIALDKAAPMPAPAPATTAPTSTAPAAATN